MVQVTNGKSSLKGKSLLLAILVEALAADFQMLKIGKAVSLYCMRYIQSDCELSFGAEIVLQSATWGCK